MRQDNGYPQITSISDLPEQSQLGTQREREQKRMKIHQQVSDSDSD